MRICIDLFAKRIPIIYRNRIMSLIKEALNQSDSKYRESLYPSEKEKKRPKHFSFGLSLPSTKRLKNDIFEFDRESRMRFIISTSDYEFLMHLYNGILKIKNFDMGRDMNIRIGKIHLLPPGEITDEEIVFKTLSPILIEDKSENPLIPKKNSKKFNKEFFEVQNRIVKSLRGKGLYKEIEFIPVKIKKQVIKHFISEFTQKTGKPYMMLTCFEGVFNLKGDVRDLQFLYDNGIGLRTSQGFGLVDIVG
ncbi:MAG: CRISPR-associated endoribonuclease Cas6 [Myxococcota bacterium]